MANTKITDLTSLTAAAGDEIPINRAGVDGKITVGSGALVQPREQLTAARTYYVRTDGSDSNTGLADTAGGAFLTVQKAFDTVAGLDLGLYNCGVTVGAGTFDGGCLLGSIPSGGGSLNVTMQGPASTTLNGGSFHGYNTVLAFMGGVIGGQINLYGGAYLNGQAAARTYMLRVGNGARVTAKPGCDITLHPLRSDAYGVRIDDATLYGAYGAASTGALLTFLQTAGKFFYRGIDSYKNGYFRWNGRWAFTGTPYFYNAFARATYGSTIKTYLTGASANNYTGQATGGRYTVGVNSTIATGNHFTTYPGNAGTLANVTGGGVVS
jgi:hypothetical protein